jgi:hypothetical protein
MTIITFPTPVSKGQSAATHNEAEKLRGAKRVTKTPALTVTVLPPDANGGAPVRELRLCGRDAWCLNELVRAGSAGITSISYPGARLSHYIFRLRLLGIDIGTTSEVNAGAFGGTHGRYQLRSRVRIISSTGLGANPQTKVVLP